MVILVRLRQSPNAKFPIEVTELGMVMLVRPLQLLNAQSPMEVTELGIVMLAKTLQLMKAESPINVTELGMIEFLQPRISVLVDVSIMALQSSRESKVGLSLATDMLVRAEQPDKPESPM